MISGYGTAAGVPNGQGAKTNGKPRNNIQYKTIYPIFTKKMNVK